MRPIMNPRIARPSVIFVVLLLIAVGTASWLGFHNGNPEPLAQIDQGRDVARTMSKAGDLSGSSQANTAAATEASTPAPSGKPLFASPVWGHPELPPATPQSSHASRAVLATATLDVKTMPMLKQLQKGDHVVLPLTSDVQLEGVVNLVVPNERGLIQVAGGFANGEHGAFTLSQSLTNPNVWSGLILRNDQHLGYQITTANGKVTMDKKPLSSMICEELPTAAREAAAALDNSAPDSPTPADASDAGAALPILSSKPATPGIGVLYLDFDGETVTDNSWNNGITIFAAPATVNGAAITAAQVTDIWKRVSEDYQPFNVTVTTDPSLYAAAPDGQRIRCIITPTSAWYPTSVGGITFIGSYRGTAAAVGFSSSIPCWVFNNTSTSVIALTISHEIGHSLGLSHDGTLAHTGFAAAAYYAGHDTGATSWGPIMGAPYGKSVTQWSQGAYPYADNTENDLLVMAATVAEALVVTGFATDEAGSTPGTAAVLPITSPISQTGIITQSSDTDWYQFSAKDGPINITVTPAAVDPDVDTELKLYDSAGVLIQTSAVLATSLSSNITRTLTGPGGAAVYYLSVEGKGRAAVVGTKTVTAVTGYPSYGSVGAYTLTGTYVTLPAEPMITGNPAPITNANQGTKVTLSVAVMSNSPVTYQWYKRTTGAPAGAVIPGKTASTLVFPSVQIADDAAYFVKVTNQAAMNNVKTSTDAVLNVYHKPAIVAKLTPSVSTVVAGQNASFAVTVTDPGKDAASVTNYVWKKNNVVIPVGTNASAGTATLLLPAVDFYAGASYTCTVSNTIGFVTSTPAVLTITSPPLFKVDLPAIRHLASGTAATAAVTVVGTAPFTYQWFKGGLPLAGATKATYAWSAAATATAAGEYWVVATGKPGGVATSTTSTHMVVDVQTKPAIATAGQPVASSSVNAGATLNLTCTATGTATLVYQWQFNNINLVNGGSISGADTGTLTINPVAWANKGTFRCIVTNAVGSVTSKNAVVNVISPPIIVTAPVGIKIATGGTGVLKVVATGTPTLKYQWNKVVGMVSTPISKATGASLTLSKATLAGTDGDYTVTITNLPTVGGGTITSTPVHATVLDAPKITTQPQAKLVSGVGKTEHFTVVATGGGTLTYQWQKNNKDILGETSATINFPSLAVTDAGTYRCIVRNEVGVATSTGGVLSVLIAPSITVQPVPVVAYNGSTISFTVVAAGSPTLTYQWEKDVGMGVFVAIPATSAVAGTTVSATAKTAVLKLVNVKTTDAGNYRVTVTNPNGSATSNIVTLGTTPVPVVIIDDFTPHKGRLTMVEGIATRPAQIIVAGQFFNFATKVQFVTAPGATDGINAAFVVNGHNEIVIDIPSSVTVPRYIEITDPSGVTASAIAFTPVLSSVPVNSTVVQPNDLLINAVNLLRPSVRGFVSAPPSNNTLASLEPGETVRFSGHTVWYHWRPATTALYNIDTVGSDHDSTLAIYTGPNVPTNGPAGLSLVIVNDDGTGTAAAARVTINVIKGKDYYLSIDSFNSASLGTVALRTYTIYAADKVNVDPATPTAETETDLASSVGGSTENASEVSAVWLPTNPSPAGSILTAKADLSIDTTIGTAEMFSWSVYDRAGDPVFALTFDATTGKVLSQVDGAEAEPTGQVFLPGAIYQLVLDVDYARGVWGASLNGVSILEDQALSDTAIKNGFGDVGAVWIPAAGATTGGTMHYGHFSVTASQPETTSSAPVAEPTASEDKKALSVPTAP